MLVGALAGPTTSNAADELPRGGWEFDVRFLEGLRQQRLFELAEAWCERREADPKLGVAARGRVVVERLRTVTELALTTPPEERPAVAERLHTLAKKFVDANSSHSIALVVRTQEALGDHTLSELARQEAEVAAGSDGRANDQARQLGRGAMRSIEQLDKELTLLIPQRLRRPASGDELTATELSALQHQLRYHGARAQRNVALSYPPDSDDRLLLLNRGLELLVKSLQQVQADDPLWPWLCCEQATALRLLGKLNEARDAALKPESSEWPTEVQAALASELVRILLAADQRAMAERVLAESSGGAVGGGATSDAGGPAELDFARLEVAVAAWRAAIKQNKAAEIEAAQQRALDVLAQIERNHGPYWRHRGDLLVVRVAGTGGPASADVLVRTADRLFLDKQYDEALAAYDQAAEKARTARDEATAFTIAYRAALVQQQREQHDSAADRLHALAMSQPRHKQAAEAHLSAAWNLAQL
ncbi:MAG TPA: hypothetical protein PLV92_01320, partial [Pirellulaceae bacterium]|nr:hypothetical protein [Pirellulaceae bacterium]